MKISFQPFEEKHFPLLLRWLKEPHVKEFWSEPEDENVLKEKYLKKLVERGVFPQIIVLNDQEVGYIQSYEACSVGGGWWPDVKPGIFGIDQFIGEVNYVGKGLGPKIISKFVKMLVQNPNVKEVIANPDPSNLRAIKAYEKAGFKQSGLIQTPNGQAMLMRYFVETSRKES